MLVTINFPPNGAINTLIAEKYARFYKNMAKRIRSPRARAILRTQLSSEAMTVASFHGQQVTYETDVRGSSYNPWKAHKWLVTKYRHWYFAGVIKKTRKGGYVFNVKDALYEGDYHNSPIPLCENKCQYQKMILKESDLKSIIRDCLNRILSQLSKQNVGKYEVIDGDSLEHEADSITQFGHFNDIRMYTSDEETYCLMRRCNNGTYFFTKIVDAPELGEKETKFVPVKPKDVPPIILRDAQSLIHSSATLHNLLF